MKKSLFRCTLACAGLLMIAPAFAHDPAEHEKAAEAPDCEAMKTMDHSKMDMNDQVMQAMMKKCGDVHHSDMHNTGETEQHESNSSTNDSSESADAH